MILRFLAPMIVVAAAIPAIGQNPPVAKAPPVVNKNWIAPHTADGQPDLQGVWTNATVTPFERPAEFAGKAFLNEDEVAAFEKEMRQRNNMDRRDVPVEVDVARAYNDFWWDRGSRAVPTRRTSLVIDPPDGKIPPLTPEAQKRAEARAEARNLSAGPESRNLQERCILWQTAGPPMVNSAYNNNYQIVQTRDSVAILSEMIHDVRTIHLDRAKHLPENVRQWMGDSIGHWEGNTLVVETTNFTDKTAYRGSSQNMRLVERFTRTGPDVILYEFTVNDPAAFTRPWTAQIPMVKNPDRIFEYACHEGNYGMEGILAGARAQEKAEGGK